MHNRVRMIVSMFLTKDLHHHWKHGESWFMQRLEVPNGLKAVGYTSSDIPALVAGTLPQHRVTKLSPRPAEPEDLAAIFESALVAW